MKISKTVIFLLFIIFLNGNSLAYPADLSTADIPAEADRSVSWKEDFTPLNDAGYGELSDGWKLQNKPGTPSAEFLVVKDETSGDYYLRMTADKASSAVVCMVKDVDLKKTPILKWCWKTEVLPDGADGRVSSKDDQAIGIYVGTGNLLRKRSISYRWDTETPVGDTGESSYAGGTVKVKWYTLRDKNDAISGKWEIEERNVAEDFKKAWGFYPEKVFLSISCNSQYTGTFAEAGLAWIEFTSIPQPEKT